MEWGVQQDSCPLPVQGSERGWNNGRPSVKKEGSWHSLHCPYSAGDLVVTGAFKVFIQKIGLSKLVSLGFTC